MAKTHSKTHQVVIVQEGDSVPDGLRQALQKKGFATQVVASNEDVRRHLIHDESITIIYCSDDTNIEDTVTSLAQYTVLHNHPLIIVGNEVDKFESYLNKYFVLATTITTPCGNSDIVSAVEYVVRYVEKLQRDRPVAVPATEAPEIQVVHGLCSQFATIPNLVFDQLIKLGILGREVGGTAYGVTFRPDKLKEQSFLPNDELIKKTITNTALCLSDLKVGRYYRIAMLSDLLFRTLSISGTTLEAGRCAAFLYSSSFIVTERDLTTNDYLLKNRTNLRASLSEKIKESAESATLDYARPGLGTIITLVASFIGEEEVPNDSIESLAASCIATADLVDRVVYERGVFQPAAAYSLLAKLKTAALPQIHPLVLGCLIKIMAEAVTSGAAGISKRRKYKNGVGPIDTAPSEFVEIDLSPVEDSVRVSALAPGMKLSRPLNTFDGKQILNNDLVLDQDLIWRLWQLAAIRPLGEPVIIFTN